MRCAVLTAFCLACLPLMSSASTYLVRPDGSGDFSTIQTAVSAAVDGDVIELADGVFSGPGNRNVGYEGKAITVRSESRDPSLCIIDCENPTGMSRAFLFVAGEGPLSVLEGVTIRNGAGCDVSSMCWGGAILCMNTAPTIIGCVFRNNANDDIEGFSSGGAIFSASESGVGATVIDCVFEDNRSNSGGALCGVFALVRGCTFLRNRAIGQSGGAAYFGAWARVENCTVWDNDSDSGSGFAIGRETKVEMSNCIVTFNRGGAGVEVLSDGVVTLECCDLFGNEGGDWVGGIATQADARGNLCLDPLFCGTELMLHADSPCAPEQNPACGLIGAWPVGCGSSPVLQTTWGALKATYR